MRHPEVVLHADAARASLAAYSRGDCAAGDALLAPDVRWRRTEEPDAAEVRGPDDFRAAMGSRLRSFGRGTARLTALELWAAGPHVFVRGEETAVGREGGVEPTRPVCAAWRFVDGRIAELVTAASPGRALGAAGLQEPLAVQRLREMHDRFNRGEHEGTLEYFAEDVEWSAQVGGLLDGTYHGREGVRRFFASWLAPFTEILTDRLEMLVLDDGDVVLSSRQRGRGRSSGVDAETHIFGRYTFRGDLIVRFRGGVSRDDVLRSPTR